MLKRWIRLLGPTLFLVATLSPIGATIPKECPQLTECSPRAETCIENSDCSADELCCGSPCGKACTRPLLTGCQQVERAARRRAKSLGREGRSVRVPRCTSAGFFEPVQCDNEIEGQCWCVDELGLEVAGTRANSAGLVNCTTAAVASRCAVPTCRMLCPLGFVLDEEGCPVCTCRDPCDGIVCPGGLACRADELPCSDPPCPPVPSCRRARSLQDLCPVGDPLTLTASGMPFLCGNDAGKPACPPTFRCFVGVGHDYGVCCPASTHIEKAGECPAVTEELDCDSASCRHDLDCRSVQKCCESKKCGRRCTHPVNLSECTHGRRLAELLAVNERSGKGYVPQCTADGRFEPRQCSRNGLVCWCVDVNGNKISGTMGAAANVTCTTNNNFTLMTQDRSRSSGRSTDGGTNCEKLDCAALCEYGFKTDEQGCPTCKCDDPCQGYPCAEDEECVTVKDSSCSDFLCPSLPVCRPKLLYSNPCTDDTPLTDDISGEPFYCTPGNQNNDTCPQSYICTNIKGFDRSVCCPAQNTSEDVTAEVDKLDKQPRTMCEYLRDFSDSMEGTQEGMRLALPTPTCNESDGSYTGKQCHENYCWCVDSFGTEIPRTRTKNNSPLECDKLRESLGCLDLTCRMGCEYGFDLDLQTRCPKCQCKDPCSAATCGDFEECRLVEVSCTDRYCPPVPACLPRKSGQCPYLVPASSTSCDIQCNSDLACNGTDKCCSNGCGTQCTEPLHLTACQHQRAVAQHQAHESGKPAGRVYIPRCTADGNFESAQCDPGTQECWCVDEKGFEMSGSRVRGVNQMNCDASQRNQCTQKLDCDNIYCEHGYVMDANGCRTCECVEPCAQIGCRGEGEQCRMVRVECVGATCPSLPMCLPSRDNPCQHGQPLSHMSCGPGISASTCPSTHKCQLSPLDEYAVCCPKPRDVCFEPKDEGVSCPANDKSTRWYFNPRNNACDNFTYAGCQGNHNNFHTEAMCGQVCPVLSQCERLREKNERAAVRYKRPTFKPRCEPETGAWMAVQCLEHVGVCWCVTPRGEPLKGTLIRGTQPDCNFRKARGRHATTESTYTDIVLEEIIMQIGTIEDESDSEAVEDSNAVIAYGDRPPSRTRCQSLHAHCDENGRFTPKQCDDSVCWCVDEAGNQLPHSSTFLPGERICERIPIEAVDITIGFRGEYDRRKAEQVIARLRAIISGIGGSIVNNELTTERTPDVLYVKFSLNGEDNVDTAFRLEQMVTDQAMANLTPDITRSRFVHRRIENNSDAADNNGEVIALEHREIVALSPVSAVAPYHTALIVIAAASAFIISVLSLLVLLHRRSTSGNCESAQDSSITDNNEHFLVCNRPVYIELPEEKSPNCVRISKQNDVQQKS